MEGLRDHVSGSVKIKWKTDLLQTVHGDVPQSELPSLPHSAEGSGRQQTRTGQEVRTVSSPLKKSDATPASWKSSLASRLHSVPSKPAMTTTTTAAEVRSLPSKDAETTTIATEAGGRVDAHASTSAESTAHIRPEDIIVIRHYNLDGSAAEKKPDEGGQTKRHVVRLVRNNILSTGMASTSVNRDHVESGTETKQQSAVVKKRSWSGVVKAVPHVSEDHTDTSRVGDQAQPVPHNRRSVTDSSVNDAFIDYRSSHYNCCLLMTRNIALFSYVQTSLYLTSL